MKMRSRFLMTLCASMLAVAVLPSCALYNSIKTGQPLNQVQVQQDLQNANYLLRAAGCTVVQQAAVAAPVVTINADAQGQQVLQAVDAAGSVACQMIVPPTALPVPLTPSTPSVAAPVPAAASTSK